MIELEDEADMPRPPAAGFAQRGDFFVADPQLAGTRTARPAIRFKSVVLRLLAPSKLQELAGGYFQAEILEHIFAAAREVLMDVTHPDDRALASSTGT